MQKRANTLAMQGGYQQNMKSLVAIYAMWQTEFIMTHDSLIKQFLTKMQKKKIQNIFFLSNIIQKMDQNSICTKKTESKVFPFSLIMNDHRPTLFDKKEKGEGGVTLL